MKLIAVVLLVSLFALSIATKPKANQVVPVIFRDFIGFQYPYPASPLISPPTPIPIHIDFNHVRKVDLAIVGALGSLENGAGFPAYASATSTLTTTNSTWFGYWYATSQYSREVDLSLTLVYSPLNGGTWTYGGFRSFFPLDGIGWGDSYTAGDGSLHNFCFTMQFSSHFYYTGDEYLTINDDDDAFVYYNGKLAINNGGIHDAELGQIDFTTLGLTIGERVNLDIFYAERHVPWATFNLTSNIYFRAPSGADPHMVGLHGEQYDLMGNPNEWFNILSDVNIQVNAHYVQGCVSKPNVTAINSMSFIIGDQRIHLDITCNATLNGKIDLLTNGPDTLLGKYGVIRHIAPQVFLIETNDYTIKVNPFIIDPTWQTAGKPFSGDDCIDGYFNFDIKMNNDLNGRNPHGIIGQTAHHKHDSVPTLHSSQGEGEIEGVFTDYIVDGMYGTNNKFNRYSLDDSVPSYEMSSKSKRDLTKFRLPEGSTYEDLVRFKESQCAKKV